MKKLNIKNVGLIAASVVVLVGAVAFATVHPTGRAIVFAITDTQTVNEAAELKSGYVKGFTLATDSPNE